MRHGLQLRRAHLRLRHHGLLRMGTLYPQEAEQRQYDPHLLPARRGPLRSALDRQRRSSRHSALHRPGMPSLDLFPPLRAGARAQPHHMEHGDDIRRLQQLRAHPDPLHGRHPDEPELARQRIRPRHLPQPRAIWRKPAHLRRDALLTGAETAGRALHRHPRPHPGRLPHHADHAAV